MAANLNMNKQSKSKKSGAYTMIRTKDIKEAETALNKLKQKSKEP